MTKKNMDVSGSPEDAAVLAADAVTDTVKSKNRPIHKIDADGLRCSIFAFKSKDGSAEYHKYSISRSYLTKEGWKHSTFFGVEDPVSRLSHEAVEYIRKLHMQSSGAKPDHAA